MGKRTLGALAALSIVALAFAVGCDDQNGPEKGKLASALQVNDKTWLNTPDGKPIKLDALKGKFILLDFWGVW